MDACLTNGESQEVYNREVSYQWKMSVGDINSSQHSFRISVTKTNILAYIDDVVLSCPTSSGLQKLIKDFSVQCDSHNLVINNDKTKFIKFGKQDGSKFYVNRLEIEVVQQYKYLGVFGSSNGSIREDVEKVHMAFNRNVGMLTR